MGFEPKVGQEFPVDVQLLNARRGLIEEVTRSYLTATITLVAVLFLIGAAVVGLFTGDFEYRGAVWVVLAAPLGTILGYYLPGRDEG
jgi:hypothetical protein